jgi:hypothetical protein
LYSATIPEVALAAGLLPTEWLCYSKFAVFLPNALTLKARKQK